MNAFGKAAYYHNKVGIDIGQDIAAYSNHGGYVFLAPDYVMWVKAVRRNGGDPDTQWNVTNPDAWYVRFALGEGCVGKFIGMMPYPLPYTGWKRRLKGKPIRYFQTEQLLRRSNDGRK